MVVRTNDLHQRIMWSVLQGVHYCGRVHQMSPGIYPCSLPDHVQVVVHQDNMFTCDQVMPFPCLATKEGQSTNDGPCQPFDHTFLVIVMTCMHRQHHGNGADDQNKGHHTHEGKWQVGMPCSGECIEHYVRVCPDVLRKADGAIRDQECSKCEGITHQEVPHHQLAILYIEWAFTSIPPICFCCRSSCCHIQFQVFSSW